MEGRERVRVRERDGEEGWERVVEKRREREGEGEKAGEGEGGRGG